MKNRSTKEILQGVTIEQRHFKEKQFFQTTPWSSLSSDRVGIPALKTFLGKLLYDHIRSEFPALVQEIRNLVVEARAQLESLGPSRQTFMEQRQFLTRLAAKYQSNVAASLTGNYDTTWESEDPRKLRMHLHKTNEAFSKRMAQRGHTLVFRLVDGGVDEEFSRPHRGDEENIYDWIRRVYLESRGSELPGTVNPTVLENMFRQQSKQWNDIAIKHVADIESIISRFNKAVFQDNFYEDTLRDKLEHRNNVPFRKATQDAAIQLASILADEREGILQTVNHYFADTLSATRQDRVLKRLQKLGVKDGCEVKDLKYIVSNTHLSNEDQAVNDIHDILKAYYKVALKRFTDNIVIQVVERYYVRPGGPIKSISAEYIGGLSDADLAHLAAENYATSTSRNDVNAKLERLEKALAIAEKEGS